MKETTRNRILEAAANWIRKEGYHSLPLRKLTAQLGFTTGAFYKAFKNKDDLFYQLCIQESRRQEERLQIDYLAQVDNPLDGIGAIGRFILAEYQTDAQMMHFLYFNPVSVAAFRQGQVLHVGEETKKYIGELGVENSVQAEKLLLKLNSFILGYGILIAQEMTGYDEAFYQSALEDLLADFIDK